MLTELHRYKERMSIKLTENNKRLLQITISAYGVSMLTY